MILIILLCGCSSKETVWVNFESPCLITFNQANLKHIIDLREAPVKLLDVKVVNTLNSEVSANIVDDKILHITYNPNFSKAKIINCLNFNGQPLIMNRATLKVKLYKYDLKKLKKDIKNYRSISYTNDTIRFDYADFELYDIYTGKIINVAYEIDNDNIKESLIKLQNIFDYNANWHKEKFFDNNKDFVSFVQDLLDGATNNNDKAKIIAKWAYENIKPLPDDLFRRATNPYSDEDFKISSVEWVWKHRQGYCSSISFLIKTMLDVSWIKNQLIVGYTPDNEGHMLNAIWDEEQETWLWLDGTTGGFNDNRMYRFFENAEVLVLP